MNIPIQRIIHINLNVSAVDPAAQFFTEGLGLQSISHMHAEPQDGAAMGLQGMAQWNGYSLHGVDHLWDSTMIDLLEWQQPAGTGKAYASPANIGFSRLALRVPDLDASYQACQSGWLEALSAPVIDETFGERFFCATNPDGSVMQLVDGASNTELWFVNINCSDLQRSINWYRDVLGFELVGDIQEQQFNGDTFGCDGEVKFLSARMQLPGRMHDCGIQLQQWLQPADTNPPYAQANHNGLYRLAMAVDDARDCYRQLLALGADCPYEPVWMDMGPDIPIDGLWALFFFDPDGTCVELIQNPELKE